MNPWADWCLDQITVEPFSCQDSYGVASYGSSVTYQARVTGQLKRVTSFAGEERVTTVTVYVSGSTGITVRDRITLPSGWTPSQPEIVAVSRIPDEAGAWWETLYCG